MSMIDDWENRKTIEGIDVKKLTPQQRKFVGRWTLHRNLTWAAKEAGYKFPNVAGSKLAASKLVGGVLKAVGKKLEKKKALELNDVLHKLSLSVNRNLHDLSDLLPIVEKIPPQCFPYIDGIDYEPIYATNEDGSKELIDTKIKIKLMSNQAALDMALKHLGGYAPTQTENKVNISWDTLSSPPPNADEVDKEIEGELVDPPRSLEDFSEGEVDDDPEDY